MLLNPIHFHFILTFPHCFSKSHRCGTFLKWNLYTTRTNSV
jgi:hypothetical protein